MATERTPLVPNSPAEPARRDFVLMMMGILSFSFLSSLDGTIVATLISTIGSSLQSMQLSSWIGTAYLLSRTASTPLYGRLANIIGRQPSIVFAGALFGVATVLCGFAQNMPQLVAYRALAGIGGSGLTVVGSIIISDSVPLKSRGLYQGFANLLWGFGAAVGAPLGGWLGDTIGWRAAFFCQAPVLACGLLLVFLKVREPPLNLNAEHTPLLAKLKRIDYAGTFSLVAALLTFLLGMNFKTILSYEWDDPNVWGYLVASVVLLCTFLVVEFKLAAEPVMAVELLRQVANTILRRHEQLPPLCPYFLHPVQHAALLHRRTPPYLRQRGLAPHPQLSVRCHRLALRRMVHAPLRSVLENTGARLPRTPHGELRPRFLVHDHSSFSCHPRVAYCQYRSARTPEWVLYTTLMPAGLGSAGTLTTTLLALIASILPDDIPLATGLSYLFRTTGEVLGVSLSAALTQALLARELRMRIVGDGADGIIVKILASAAYIHTLPTELQEKATASWMRALHVVFQCQMAVAVLLFLSSLLIEEFPLPDTVAAGQPAESPTVRDAEAASEDSADQHLGYGR